MTASSSSNDELWASCTDEAMIDEIRSNRRSERRLLVVVGLVAAACTIVVLILHGPIFVTRVLVVDDEPDERALLTRHLERIGCEVVAAATAEIALADEDNLDVDAAFVDLRLPGMSGAELVVELRARRPGISVVVTSVLDTEDYPLVEAWLPKPFTGEGVHQALVAALAAR